MASHYRSKPCSILRSIPLLLLLLLPATPIGLSARNGVENPPQPSAGPGPEWSEPSSRSQTTDSASLITRLGSDTLAVERFVHHGSRFEAEVLLRSPRISRTRYILELSPAGGLDRLETIALDPSSGSPTGPRTIIAQAGDSLQIETTTGTETTTRTVMSEGVVLPFIDMVHWPFELALRRARGGGGTVAAAFREDLERTLARADARVAGTSTVEIPQPMLSGARISTFQIGILSIDSMTITHPTRGTMQVEVDPDGRLLTLDAGATTRKLIVERGGWIDLGPFATRWAELDARGQSFGALSGRGEEESSVHGANITVDYGTPLRRGREIWGALVPYGEVWRTGANQATHFSTDRDLIFEGGLDPESRVGSMRDDGVRDGAPETSARDGSGLVVPAGEYTLFSIPEESGGILIINRQTGQTGTAYDPAHDHGHLPLRVRPLDDPVEVFTIRVDEVGDGGELRLQWDRKELVARFRVR